MSTKVQKIRTTVDLIQERGTTHGDFEAQSQAWECLHSICMSMPNWPTMRPAQRQAIRMALLKMVRAGYGDPDFKDHWDDIAGYAQLGKVTGPR